MLTVAYAYTLALVTVEELNDATRLGLCDIVTDVIEGEGVEVANAITIRLAGRAEPVRHVIVVETNDPSLDAGQMADAVLDALHTVGNHDVTHVSAAGQVGARAVLSEVIDG